MLRVTPFHCVLLSMTDSTLDCNLVLVVSKMLTMSNQNGFTLLESLIVTAVVGIAASIAVHYVLAIHLVCQSEIRRLD